MAFMQGALVIDKPADWTSHDVVARVRSIIGERRVGHTGTLDPFATGVLVVLVGRATRLAQFLTDAEKEYQAVIRFGYATDTGDLTGAQLPSEFHATTQSPQSFHKEEIETAIASLRGEISQMPPMYSAKKVGGRRLYKLARSGENIEREPVTVNILEFEALSSADPTLEEDGTVDLPVRVVCSAGTYIRTLAEDLGKRLGVGAHLTELRRTRAGTYKIEQAITLERLGELVKSEALPQVLISPDELLSHLPAIQLTDEEANRARHGIDLRIEETVSSSWEDEQPVRLRDASGKLMAVGEFSRSEASVHPSVVIAGEP
ncbi:MAG TPA: tRNA pseudouridine(55) synthase TruB [Pyrinomonadaceae bacterium]|nr:tRNA pseudouridine(55) synthase TruB [Pyrinomonadaceae bacterium]